jgi:16S rRNA C1402 (ribose-2'-O) methylase RsmI
MAQLQQLIENFSANPPRGEIVIVVAGITPPPPTKVDKYAKFKNVINKTNIS